MKKEFSQSWKGSKQPRKQRKYQANLPLHTKHEMLSATLTKDLRKKHGKRNFPLRKGDEVKVMRGEFKKKTGKISQVYRKKMKVAIEGLQRKKKDGTKINVLFDTSSLQITSLDLSDKKRIKAIERKIPLKKEKINVKKTNGEKNAPKKTSNK